MKRDMDTVRSILLAVENLAPQDAARVFAPADVSIEDLEAHMPLLLDRDLISAKEWSTLQNKMWGMVRLTWEGHDFLDTIRDDEVWAATKDGVKKAGGFSLELMKALAKGLLRKKIEHHTGIELDL